MKTSVGSMVTALLIGASLAAGARSGEPGAFTASKGDRTIQIDGPTGPVAEYVYRPSPLKPYLARWYTPAGLEVLRDSPADHKHHHALMFAIGIDGVDFWGETKGCGVQADRGVDGPRTGRIGGMLTAEFNQRLEWLDADQKPLVVEQRTVTLVSGERLPTRLLIWRTRLVPAAGRKSVKLWGRDYFGLGVRLAASMDQRAQMLFPAGAKAVMNKGHLLTQARWGACVGPIDGQTATLALFDHPRNPRHPAQFFTMTKPFAYLSSTLGLAHEPLILEAAGALELCYGAALWDGPADAPHVEAFYQRWLAMTARQGAD